jgi:ribosomal-protein-alanine N-acetyltransferase
VSQTCSVGYWVGEQYARRGYMTAALIGVLPFAFDTLNLHRVSAACLPHNTASRTLLEKVGFSEEGFARKYLRINGSWQDHVLYAMLGTDSRPSLDSLVAPASGSKSFASHLTEDDVAQSAPSGVSGFARQK